MERLIPPFIYMDVRHVMLVKDYVIIQVSRCLYRNNYNHRLYQDMPMGGILWHRIYVNEK